MPQVSHANICTWCTDEIVRPEIHKRAGERNRRREWHPDCVIAYKLAISSTEQRRAVFARDHGRCAECGAFKRRKVVVRWQVRRHRSADAIVRAALRKRCPAPIVMSGFYSGVDSVLSMPWALAKTATSAARRARPPLKSEQSPDTLSGLPPDEIRC